MKLSVLKQDAELAAGDPIFCQKCNAVFNVHSQLGQQKLNMEEIKEEVDAEMEDESMQKQEADMKDEKIKVDMEEEKIVDDNDED